MTRATRAAGLAAALVVACSASQQTNSASDFRNANLAITLTPAASGQGE